MLREILCVSIVCSLCACSSVPSKSITMVGVALDSVRQADVDDYAAQDLQEAQDRWALAKKAQAKNDAEMAERYAQETLVNIELAEARAREQKILVAIDEVQSSLDRLRTLMSGQGGE